jgi:hypothetical protein
MTYVSNNDIYWVGSSFIDSLKYTNFIPYVKNPIPDQTAVVGLLFSFTMPDSTFMDDDGNHTLTYDAHLTNGDPLPAWLAFDTIAGAFSGTPVIHEILNIIVIASDTAGANTSTDFKITADTLTSINQYKWPGIRILPNPTTGLIYISSDEPLGEMATVEICNLAGKIIKSTKLKSNITIDLTSEPKGIYMIRLHNENEIMTSKICIQ